MTIEIVPDPSTNAFDAELHRFRSSLSAVRNLERFLDEQLRVIDDPIEGYVMEAAKLLPTIPAETHREAGKVLGEWFSSLHTGDDPPDEKAQLGMVESFRKNFRAIVEQLGAITGVAHYIGPGLSAFTKAATRPTGESVIRSSLLVSSVSAFEVLVSGLVRATLKAKPELLHDGDRKYALSDVERFGGLEEFREHCREVVAENLLRDSFEEWMAWFSGKAKVTVDGVTAPPPELVEVFQRRNVIVHAGGAANRIYLQKTEQKNVSIGDVLSVDSQYLLGAIDRLATAGVKLAMMLDAKWGAGGEKIESKIQEVLYEELVDGNFAVVEDIGTWALKGAKTDDALLMRVNVWAARKASRGLSEIEGEVRAWSVKNLAEKFRLAKHALLDEHERAADLARDMLQRRELSPLGWLGWPILDGARAHAGDIGDVQGFEQALEVLIEPDGEGLPPSGKAVGSNAGDHVNDTGPADTTPVHADSLVEESHPVAGATEADDAANADAGPETVANAGLNSGLGPSQASVQEPQVRTREAAQRPRSD